MFPRGLAEGSGVETNTPLFLSPALKAPPESLLPDCIEEVVEV